MTGEGIDYRHPVFRNSDGTSRILSIWDQTIQEGPSPKGFFYGTEYEKKTIDEALSSLDPYKIVPSVDTNGHGTYVASLAAGGEHRENSFIGAAPLGKIAVVKLKESKQYLKEFFFVEDEVVVFQENDIMTGIAYLDRLAYEWKMPLVICMSLGSNWGSHGGSGFLSMLLNTMVKRRMRAAVIAAGNEANERHHFYGAISREDNKDSELVEIDVGENTKGFTVELWSSLPEIFTLEIISPTGEKIPRLSQNDIFQDYTFIFENTRVTINKNLTFPDNDLQLIFLRFQNPTQGIWNLRVFPEDSRKGMYHIWLPMKQHLSGNVFFLQSSPDTTITIPGNAANPITVGGYDASNNSLYLESGRGYTIQGVIKPELVAPAVDVLGAGKGEGFQTRTGTSAAAAITSGTVALIFEWAIVKENYPRITSSDVKIILIRGAGEDLQRLYPNREWGYGTLDIYEAFRSLRMV